MEQIPLSWCPIEGAEAYQLVLYDRTTAETILDERVPGPQHAVLLSAEQRAHDVSMRVRAWRDSSWGDWTEFKSLPLEIVLGERRDSLPSLTARDGPGLLLMFTVDTECSLLRQPNPDPDKVVDELIFGNFGNENAPGGIGLHMDLLEHFGFRGCFFVDVLMEYQHGRRALERTIEAIAERGHEIQLHVHSDHLGWSGNRRISGLSGALGSKDQDVFRRLMELSIDLFERRVGHRPIAYRAGGYRIADTHFPILEEFGILADSSVQPYFNSRVSDWMRTRTQPFWVDGVLEIPPTLILLNDDPQAWETRSFQPNHGLGDPVSVLSAEPGEPPCVATYVSHSFQLLRRHQTSEWEAVGDFVQRLRTKLPTDAPERMRRWSPREVRTFGEEIDDGLVAATAGVLRRIADRSDARCVTFGELVKVADRLWPSEQHPPIDPIPLLNRRLGIAGVTGTRIFSRDLLSHLTVQASTRSTPIGDVDPTWVDGLERCKATELRQKLEFLTSGLEPGELLPIRFRTLGIASTEARGVLPPFAELLFPAAALRALSNETGADSRDVLAWDVPTFHAWLKRSGFDVVNERRLQRCPTELAAADRFKEKLRWIDPLELRTEAWEVTLRRSHAAVDLSLPKRPPIERVSGGPISTAVMTVAVEPELLPSAAVDYFESTQPGHELRFEIIDTPGPVSRTTCLLAMMRAGFEVIEKDEIGYRLIRPVELSDIRRFAGLD